MKKRLRQIFGLLLTFILLISPLLPVRPATAFADTACKIYGGEDSGIVFKESQHIGITKQALNITVNDDTTADIHAVYTIKNTSNQSINTEAAILSPALYDESKEISIRQNGEQLDYLQEFFCPYLDYNNTANNLQNWQSTLDSVRNQHNVLGVSDGFWQYRISRTDKNILTASFTATSTYFWHAQEFMRYPQDFILLKSYNDIIIVSRQDFIPQTNGSVVKTQIPDIYSYLLQNALSGATDSRLRFAEQQFNLYLAGLDLSHLDQSFFSLDFIYEYVAALTFFVSILPKQQLELTVQYTYQMKTQGFNPKKLTLNYCPTPAQYFKDFEGLEISLSLSPAYNNILYSTLELEKTEDGYVFLSDSAIDSSIKITVGNDAPDKQGLPFSIESFFKYLAIIVATIGTTAIAILIIKDRRRLKNK